MTVLEPPATGEIVPMPDMDARIEQWFATHIHNSVVARDTEIFNHVSAAKDDLKRLLSPSAPEPAAAATQETDHHG